MSTNYQNQEEMSIVNYLCLTPLPLHKWDVSLFSTIFHVDSMESPRMELADWRRQNIPCSLPLCNYKNIFFS